MVERGTLNTEQQNKVSFAIDDLSISDILHTINREDQTVALAVEKTLPEARYEPANTWADPRARRHPRDDGDPNDEPPWTAVQGVVCLLDGEFL